VHARDPFHADVVARFLDQVAAALHGREHALAALRHLEVGNEPSGHHELLRAVRELLRE